MRKNEELRRSLLVETLFNSSEVFKDVSALPAFYQNASDCSSANSSKSDRCSEYSGSRRGSDAPSITLSEVSRDSNNEKETEYEKYQPFKEDADQSLQDFARMRLRAKGERYDLLPHETVIAEALGSPVFWYSKSINTGIPWELENGNKRKFKELKPIREDLCEDLVQLSQRRSLEIMRGKLLLQSMFGSKNGKAKALSGNAESTNPLMTSDKSTRSLMQVESRSLSGAFNSLLAELRPVWSLNLQTSVVKKRYGYSLRFAGSETISHVKKSLCSEYNSILEELRPVWFTYEGHKNSLERESSKPLGSGFGRTEREREVKALTKLTELTQEILQTQKFLASQQTVHGNDNENNLERRLSNESVTGSYLDNSHSIYSDDGGYIETFDAEESYGEASDGEDEVDAIQKLLTKVVDINEKVEDLANEGCPASSKSINEIEAKLVPIRRFVYDPSFDANDITWTPRNSSEEPHIPQLRQEEGKDILKRSLRNLDLKLAQIKRISTESTGSLAKAKNDLCSVEKESLDYIRALENSLERLSLRYEANNERKKHQNANSTKPDQEGPCGKFSGIKVKTRYNDTIITTKLKDAELQAKGETSNGVLVALKTRVVKKFKARGERFHGGNDSDSVLEYKDEDGDFIQIKCDEDLLTAIDLSQYTQGCLYLYLRVQ